MTFLIEEIPSERKPEMIETYFRADGNIFAVMGKVSQALRRSDLTQKRELIEEIQTRVTSSHDYSLALSICLEYVNLIDDEDDTDEEDEDDWEMGNEGLEDEA
jgi:hypothetical protein